MSGKQSEFLGTSSAASMAAMYLPRTTSLLLSPYIDLPAGGELEPSLVQRLSVRRMHLSATQ